MTRAALAAAGLVVIAACGVLLLFASTRRAVQLRVGGRMGTAPSRAGASLARGAYLFERGARCAGCHASDAGGAYVIRDRRIATLWGPNLTRGNPSVGRAYTDADFERAIRRGLRPSGQRLLGMPSWDYAAMSDGDVASLIAFIRARPPVVRDTPSFALGVIGRVEMVTGALGFDADRIGDGPGARAMPAVPGLNVARVAGCLRCHASEALAAPPPLPPEHAGSPLRALPALDMRALAAVVRDARAPDGAAVAEHVQPAVPARPDDADVAALCAALRCATHSGPTSH